MPNSWRGHRLDLLGSRIFSRGDVCAARQGNCGLLPLTERLAGTTGSWAKAVAPWTDPGSDLPE